MGTANHWEINSMSKDADNFDRVVRKVLSVSHEQLGVLEREWKQKRAKKKRAKVSPASRASGAKG